MYPYNQPTSAGLQFGAMAPQGPAPHPLYAPQVGVNSPLQFGASAPAPMAPAMQSRAPTVSTQGSSMDMVTADAMNTAGGAVPEGAAGGIGGIMMNADGSLNLNAIGTIGKVIGGFGQVYAGIQANKIAKDSLNFQKESYATNLTNQLSSYNLALEDRVRARYKQEGRSGEADGYINKHRLGE